MTITALNGRLPDALLVVVDTGPNGPQRLHVAVAPVWAQMLADGMPPGCLRSGYRTLAQQADEHTRNPTGALPPGESEHGEGYAADQDEPARTWAHQHAADYGLRFPLMATEPWHDELDQAHTRTEEDDMPYSRDDLKEIIAETIRENLGDLAPADSWGPASLRANVKRAVMEQVTATLRSEGVSGAADVGRLAAAIVPAIVQAIPSAAGDLTPEQITTAVHEALKDLTLTLKEPQ